MRLPLLLVLAVLSLPPASKAGLLTIVGVTMNRPGSNNCNPGGTASTGPYCIGPCYDIGPNVPPDRPMCYGGCADAMAAYGELYTSVSGFSEMDGFHEYASAGFSDVFYLFGSGQASLSLSFDVSMLAVTLYGSVAELSSHLRVNDVGFELVPGGFVSTVQVNMESPAFSLGEPFPLDVSLVTELGTGFPYVWPEPFDTTVRLVDMRLLDATGAPLSGFDYGTASGTTYPLAGGTPIPEPATLLLLGTGVLALLRPRLSRR